MVLISIRLCMSKQAKATTPICMKLKKLSGQSIGFLSVVADPERFLGFRGTILFVVLRACVAGPVHAHERSQKRSGQRNPPFQNPRSATDLYTFIVPVCLLFRGCIQVKVQPHTWRVPATLSLAVPSSPPPLPPQSPNTPRPISHPWFYL